MILAALFCRFSRERERERERGRKREMMMMMMFTKPINQTNLILPSFFIIPFDDSSTTRILPLDVEHTFIPSLLNFFTLHSIMNGESSERLPIIIPDNIGGLEPRTFLVLSARLGVDLECSDSRLRARLSSVSGSGGVAVRFSAHSSTDLVSDDDEVLATVCDSRISSRRQIAEFEGDTRSLGERVSSRLGGSVGVVYFRLNCGGGAEVGGGGG